jgi:hypothetical protein
MLGTVSGTRAANGLGALSGNVTLDCVEEPVEEPRVLTSTGAPAALAGLCSESSIGAAANLPGGDPPGLAENTA